MILPGHHIARRVITITSPRFVRYARPATLDVSPHFFLYSTHPILAPRSEQNSKRYSAEWDGSYSLLTLSIIIRCMGLLYYLLYFILEKMSWNGVQISLADP